MARILIVDDSIVMRKNLIAILEAEGHEIVGEATNGRQALVSYLDLKPDVVTMDISMPIMSGVEAVKRIIEKDPNAKIVMISAVNQKKMVFNAINSGAKHYIVKPIVANKVIGIVNEVLETSYEEEDLPIKEEVVNKQGFEINNVDGKFIITFNKYLDKSDHNLLNMAVRGILFIKPLHVEFNFNELDDVDSDLLNPVLVLAGEIEENDGTVSYVSDSDSITEKLPK